MLYYSPCFIVVALIAGLIQETRPLARGDDHPEQSPPPPLPESPPSPSKVPSSERITLSLLNPLTPEGSLSTFNDFDTDLLEGEGTFNNKKNKQGGQRRGSTQPPALKRNKSSPPHIQTTNPGGLGQHINSTLPTLPEISTANITYVKKATPEMAKQRWLSNKASDSAEFKLHQKLIGADSHYLKHIRPLLNSSKPIIVDVGLSVNMVEELVERDQTMVMVATVKMKWNDSYLTWDPRDYNNIAVIAISTDMVWLPDITVVNSPETIRLTHKTTHVQVDSDGSVGYYPSGRLVTRCNLHIRYFPYDKQHCEVMLESWIYSNEHLQIKPYTFESGGNTVDVRESYTNHQWAITGHRVQLGITLYDGYNFSSIAFIFMLERKSDYYFMYYIFPQLLLASLQTLSHTLPVEHPGRMALLTSLFIGTSVTQASVAVQIPKSSDSTSLLQIYMTMNSCNLVLSLLVTFAMMYAVLRIPNMHPDKDPSVFAMLRAMFAVSFPNFLPLHFKPMLSPSPSTFNSHRHRNTSPGDSDDDSGGESRASSPPPSRHQHQRHHPSNTMPNRHHSSNHHNHVKWSPSDGELNARHPANDHMAGVSYVETELSENVVQKRYPVAVSRSNSNSNIVRVDVGASNGNGVFHPHYVAAKSSLVSKGSGSNKNLSDQQDYYQQHSSRRESSLQGSPTRQRRRKSPLSRNGSTRSTAATTPPSNQQAHAGANKEKTWLLMDTGDNYYRRRRNSSIVGAHLVDPSSGGTLVNHEDFVLRGEVLRVVKRRWLLYTVALDKSIMYAQAFWHTFVPFYLFVIVPYYAPSPEPHVHTQHED